MTIKYLTFDCYGTLIDWKKGIESNFVASFAGGVTSNLDDIFSKYVTLESALEGDYMPYKDILRITSQKLATSLGLPSSEQAGEQFAASIVRWPAFGDTRFALEKLGKLGYKKIILSNIDRDLLRSTIANNRLEIDDFITAEDVGSYKPNKKHWEYLFKKFGVERGEVIHVACSLYHDITPASELGLTTVWVNRYRDKQPADVKPSFTIERLTDLTDVLGSLGSRTG